jgi:hypothetical protein
MKTSRLLLTASLIFAATTVFSQVKIGPALGINFANSSVKFDGEKINTTGVTLFHWGAIAEISIAENFAFQPGLLYSSKGFKMKEVAPELQGVSVTRKVNYLDIPLNFMYKVNMGQKSNFIVLAGPYLSYGLSGTSKVGGDLGGFGSIGSSQDIKFGSGDDAEAKRFDFGLNGGAGFQFGKFQITAQYGLGLYNTTPIEDVKAYSHVFGISTAFLFGK